MPRLPWRFTCAAAVLLALAVPSVSHAFYEDVCLSRGRIVACVDPQSACLRKPAPDAACPREVLEGLSALVTKEPGRSTIHADATFFLAQALGYRADVAYWIAAYNEVTDLSQYVPFDQCGVQASRTNSGRNFITAEFNGFQRTNTKTDGPLYHYVAAFSPNGAGTDVHGAGGVQAVYPFHFPSPGAPQHYDDIYQGTLYNLRQWAMRRDPAPGLLCAAGLTTPHGVSHFSGDRCLEGLPIRGTVPVLSTRAFGPKLDAHTGPKLLDSTHGPVLYDQLQAWLADHARTTGALWKDPAAPPVPVQLARIGIYLHTLQDTVSHATYCGDDAPSPPGGSDVGTYMALSSDGVEVKFGSMCATVPHILGHVQETATGDAPLPLRDYTALDATLEELVNFGNLVARPNGWLSNPELLPPDVLGGKNGQGQSVAGLEAELVGTVVHGERWTRGEVYRSGVVTRPLQVVQAVDRLHAMNAALADYSELVRRRSRTPAAFKPLELMPGNSKDPADRSVCFKPLPAAR